MTYISCLEINSTQNTQVLVSVSVDMYDCIGRSKNVHKYWPLNSLNCLEFLSTAMINSHCLF